ncbi:hypothetical protein JTE90_002544 [Oedothorax gibbosus]|uniref:Uncharacterized protein n=1 Tax=Oedothorax gibbosus TaxID=931172 RepID=A0AAV6V4E6_9ARAC|nr:hypothetical protein JTE90_002544 [Oedothorax gibbosus]
MYNAFKRLSEIETNESISPRENTFKEERRPIHHRMWDTGYTMSYISVIGESDKDGPREKRPRCGGRLGWSEWAKFRKRHM